VKGEDRSALRRWADNIKTNTCALYLASRDPAVPRAAKVIIALVIAYALSPIDLIPDFIPIIGYLDDLVLLPLGIWLAIRLVPREVWRSCKARARERVCVMPRNRWAGVVIVALWCVVLVVFLLWIWRWAGGISR
jgi:uncharacterized membrane protein YkvA (DUF1232 family)